VIDPAIFVLRSVALMPGMPQSNDAALQRVKSARIRLLATGGDGPLAACGAGPGWCTVTPTMTRAIPVRSAAVGS